MSNDEFLKGQERARRWAEDLRKQKAKDEAMARDAELMDRAMLRHDGFKQGQSVGAWIGALSGLLAAVGIWAALSWYASAWPNRWVRSSDRLPPARELVAVTTHRGWVQGFVDDAGDFRNTDDGSIIRGSYYWCRLPERP